MNVVIWSIVEDQRTPFVRIPLFEGGNEAFFESFCEHVAVEVIVIVSSRMFVSTSLLIRSSAAGGGLHPSETPAASAIGRALLGGTT